MMNAKRSAAQALSMTWQLFETTSVPIQADSFAATGDVDGVLSDIVCRITKEVHDEADDTP
jgi:hypothetical protein